MTEPTDAEIFVVAREAGLLPDNSHPAPETWVARKRSNAVLAFARTVLAKWGQPPQISQPAKLVEPDGRLSDELRNMIEGMSVSVDVSTGDHDAGCRYFGTVTEVMDDISDRYGVTLLVQDAEPNFAPTPPTQAQAGAVPLTDEQIVGVMHSIPINAAPSHHIAFARAIEQAHGIKGGQHGIE